MDEPIACSLDSADARTQLESWRAVLGAAVASVERTGPESVRMHLNESAEVDSLVALAQREVACCPFFRFRLDIAAGGVAFDVFVPAEATTILDDFIMLAGRGLDDGSPPVVAKALPRA